MTLTIGVWPPSPDRRLRTLLASGAAALALVAGLASPADAQRGYGYSPFGGYFAPPPSYAPARRARTFSAPSRGDKAAEPKKDVGFGELPKGPLQIFVSIQSQRVTLFANGQRVAQGPVSTGVPGHPTPLGVFSIIEKDRHHRSNIYHGAPMPFMQRITWSGIALHEGALPGHPASHGCIRLSRDFAQKLWPVTKLGVRVIVARDELAPRDFDHPKLFGPKQKPVEVSASGGLVRVAQANIGVDSDASLPSVTAEPTPVERKPAEPLRVEEPMRVEVPKMTESAAPAAPAPERSERVAVDPPAAEPAEQATGTVQAPAAPATEELRKAVDVPQAGGAGVAQSNPVEAPQTPARNAVEEPAKPAPAAEPGKPAAPARTKAADQPAKRGGQIAVFVSRKEGKIFVRQGFIPLFDMPIKIAEPEQPLGTHVYTAMGFADQGNGMRWNLITVPSDTTPVVERRVPGKRTRELVPVRSAVPLKPPSTAAEALNRVDFPQEAVERIAELLIPGSSLVISDEGLGRETGRYTEFIVLTR